MTRKYGVLNEMCRGYTFLILKTAGEMDQGIIKESFFIDKSMFLSVSLIGV